MLRGIGCSLLSGIRCDGAKSIAGCDSTVAKAEPLLDAAQMGLLPLRASKRREKNVRKTPGSYHRRHHSAIRGGYRNDTTLELLTKDDPDSDAPTPESGE